MKITKETTIGEIISNDYEIDNNIDLDKIYTNDLSKGTITLFFKKKSKSATQLANELNFKIGDKCWLKTGEYWSKIKSFVIWNDNLMCIADENYYRETNIDIITNNVVIYCKTEEDFDCVQKLLEYGWSIHSKDDCININYPEHGSKESYEKDSYLVISVDEYMLSQNIKPIFVTKDGKNIYEYMSYWCHYKDGSGGNVFSTISPKENKDLLYFSTKQAAEEYAKSLKVKYALDKDWIIKESSSQLTKEDKLKLFKERSILQEHLKLYSEGYSLIYKDKAKERINEIDKLLNL